MDNFIDVFKLELKKSMLDNPDFYSKSYDDTLKAFIDIAFIKGTYDKNSPSIRQTCKKLGIKNTYLDIDYALKGIKRKS